MDFFQQKKSANRPRAHGSAGAGHKSRGNFLYPYFKFILPWPEIYPENFRFGHFYLKQENPYILDTYFSLSRAHYLFLKNLHFQILFFPY
jgi:hypothetical protein